MDKTIGLEEGKSSSEGLPNPSVVAKMIERALEWKEERELKEKKKMVADAESESVSLTQA